MLAICCLSESQNVLWALRMALGSQRPDRHMSSVPSGTSPKLLDRLRAAIRARHYSRRTEKAYVGWVRRYILFSGLQHPDGFDEVKSWPL